MGGKVRADTVGVDGFGVAARTPLRGKKRAESCGEHAAAVLSCVFLGSFRTKRNGRFRFLKSVFPEARGFQILKPVMPGWLHIPFVLCNQSLGPRGTSENTV